MFIRSPLHKVYSKFLVEGHEGHKAKNHSIIPSHTYIHALHARTHVRTRTHTHTYIHTCMHVMVKSDHTHCILDIQGHIITINR